jgi:hypothetical protein
MLLCDYVNFQNMQIWSDGNPHAVHQVPLYDIKVGEWCAVSARQIMAPVFFYMTVNLVRYI